MNELSIFLSNPIVGFIGYMLSVIAAIIAIVQAIKKNNALQKIKELNVQITNIKNENKNSVTQGEKSQYFQDNNGPVNIDNRG